ncbi:tetratricopeptide repeat protein [Kordia jejudonensis]|uniref:tetratricopeptide repeat protein n=1 Tax=Kordia jejudonensis TaxID=1348245 RepID=UPI00062964B1|nr:tetratricopeptide repeat protein [Kordia jejudonensis]
MISTENVYIFSPMNYLTRCFILLFLLLNSCGFTNVETYYNEALVYEERGDYKKAIELLSKALAKQPDYIDGLVFRAFCKSKLTKFEEAINDLEKALELEPENTMTLFNIAENYKVLENYAKAVEYYTKALASKYVKICSASTQEKLLEIVNPFEDSDETGYEIENCELYFQRGFCYYYMEAYELAIPDFEKSIEGNFENLNAYMFLGELYVKLNKTEKACDCFSLAKKFGNHYAQEKIDSYCLPTKDS